MKCIQLNLKYTNIVIMLSTNGKHMFIVLIKIYFILIIH